MSIILGLMLSSAALATNGMRVIGIGPVQRAMGGVNAALALDSAVSLTNPAGLMELDRRTDVSVTYFVPRVRYKATSTTSMVTQNDTFFTSEMGPCYLPAVGMTRPVNTGSTLGFGVYGVCGMGVQYPSNLYHNVTYTEYQMMTCSPAWAHRLNDRASMGLALKLDYALMEFNAGSPAQQAHNDGEAFGLGVTIGTVYRLCEDVTLGLAYESKQDFSDFEFVTAAGTDKLNLNLPQSLTIGVGLRPSKRLRMAFDVSWIDWPQTMGENQPPYTLNSSGAMPWSMNWDEQWVYKFGLEYDLNPKTQVRLGYNYAKAPLDASRAFETIAFPAIAEQHVTGGLALHLSDTLILHLGAMVAPKVTFETANTNQFIDRAVTEMSQYAVDVGMTFMGR